MNRGKAQPLSKLTYFRLKLVLVGVFTISALAQSQTAVFEKTFQEGTTAMRGGQLEQAASAFTQVTIQAPAFAEAYFNLGLVRLQQGRLDEAARALDRAVALKPKLRGANLFLGIARYRKNDYPQAIAALKRETQVDPTSSKAFMWLGVTQLASGDDVAATNSLDKAAALNPDDVDILYHRGRAHMLVSKESYERMYKVDPNSWRIHQVLAQSFVEADRLDEAANECRQAIQLKEGEPGLHEELADIYLKQNQLSQAEAEFQNEIKIDPESVTAMFKLAVVSLERSKPEAAAALLTEVLRRTPDSSEAHYQMGRVQTQLGNVDVAIASFNTAVRESGTGDTETLRQSYYQLAQLYRREQKADESRAALDSFMRLKQQADAQQERKLQDKLKRSAQMQEATP
jgi:tetratricopeptide (TPR) repeat protein